MSVLVSGLDGTAEEPEKAADIGADIAATFTYASFQNAIPVIRSIAIQLNDAGVFGPCELRLKASPAFLRPKTWALERLILGETFLISDRKVDLNASYLAGLDEAERGTISLSLVQGERVLAEVNKSVRLLARDEWGGVSDMAQLLPAFVMPNDPAVARILKAAADQLAVQGHPSGLDGYQSNSPQRAYMLTAAIWSAMSGLGLHYAEPPASFEVRGQKVRRPSVVIDSGLATCLDTSVTLAACLESVGLHPVLLMFERHSAVGVWLTKRTLASAIEQDVVEIRKAIALRELLVLETTGLTNRPPMTLEQARTSLMPRFDEVRSTEFLVAVDVHRSRSGGITPLASHEVKTLVEEGAQTEFSAVPLPPLPSADLMPADEVEQKPTTAAGRIDRWQKKLLDLTLRNRLLNFPDTKKSIPFLCPDIARLEDRLADGASIRVLSLPMQNPVGERDEALYRDVRGEEMQHRFALEALQRDELTSPLDTKELDARQIELYRQARSDMAEGGANTLFLAIGFLRWKKKPEDAKSYRAPLLLIPVKLERKSASSPYNLRYHEDEPRFNATLVQFIQREFQLTLPPFDQALPTDDSGIDVRRLLTQMRQAVRDVPGMEVVDETALSTFSFAKFLMWKDLVERTDALRQNRVVKHLIDSPEQAFATNGAFADEREIDKRYSPAEIITLLPADSSQIAASLAAAEGRDFVIVGPPGTGKSQTIANMIAHCLAVGKTVLFVAEKTAALDVVHRRLRENGLGPHCLELHSNKSDRKGFLGQLKTSWESTRRFSESEWVSINEKLRLRRDELNAYVDVLHRPHSNGLTIYRALGIAARGHSDHAPTLSFPNRNSHDEALWLKLEETATELGRVFDAVERQSVLTLIDRGDWSSAWQEELLVSAHALNKATDRLLSTSSSFLRVLDLEPAIDFSSSDIDRLAALAQHIIDTAGEDHSIAFDRDFNQLQGAFADLNKAVNGYREAQAGLSAPFASEKVRIIPLDQLENDWREAHAALWPMSWIRQRRVRKLLQTYSTGGKPKPEQDFDHLRAMQAHAVAVEANLLAVKPSGFSGLDTDLSRVERRLRAAGRLRESLGHIGRAAEDLRRAIDALTPVLAAADADAPARQVARAFLQSRNAFSEEAARFAELAGRDPLVETEKSFLVLLSEQTRALAQARSLLRDWATWCRIRQSAEAMGLKPLVVDLEAGAISPRDTGAAFRLAYARWWLPQVMDDEPVLREFRRFQHEHAIEEFRTIDDIVRKAASGRVIKAVAHDLPSIQNVPRRSELGDLRHQMDLQRPNKTIREMISSMPQTFVKLAPCLLMSPLSIAQYLPPDQALFDVVIFDEASQITTWDAVGAIARGKQTIIVGDPKQLPPTNFFGRNEEDEDVVEYERDLESILDEAKNAGLPVRDLRWHYRSRNESLIAFSNHHYYQNRLVTFPSPSVVDRAVQLRAIPEGIYDRGKSRTNKIEADAIAKEAVTRMKAWLRLPPDKRKTLGVITFNAQQQSLIQDRLDEACRQDPSLEWFFDDDRIEPTIVRNLENVQGDERDIILFSITFTKDVAGKRTMDFGALNRDGGERRLNVAVTRAREELLVFSGFMADQIDTNRSKAVGVQHLKAFLDFAARGAAALPAQDTGSMGGYDSPFEEAVAAELEKRGWSLVPQVGLSGFRIDLGVRHPDKAGTYIAGVECDGATYHSSATARDRDKVREQVLRGLGWEIVRVWSTDWWFDSKGATERLHNALNELLNTSRGAISEERLTDQDNEPRAPDHAEVGNDFKADSSTLASVSGVAGELAAKPVTSLHDTRYRHADLSGFLIEPDRFYDVGYQSTLKAMVEAVLNTEAPLREDILMQRIARAHGWQRTGSRISDQILLHLKKAERTHESSGKFVWIAGTVKDFVLYRAPASDEFRRSVLDVPLAELANLVAANPSVLRAGDPALVLARFLGVERLTSVSRARLEEAIARYSNH